MKDPDPTLSPPSWVTKRDGRVVPFDGDKITRALFAATETLGRPDAFMARELTDGVLHFLDAELDGSGLLLTGQIGDLVAKVVRELGQPLLAQAFADYPQSNKVEKRLPHNKEKTDLKYGQEPLFQTLFSSLLNSQTSLQPPQNLAWLISGLCLKAFSLEEVFGRDLVSAHSDGLISLSGLEAPFELAGCVLSPPHRDWGGLVESIENFRGKVGQFLVLDGPEYGLPAAFSPSAVWERFERELGIGLRATGLRAVVNLNCGTPPLWADKLAEGPLFQKPGPALEDDRCGPIADGLLEILFQAGPLTKQIRVDWHLGEKDFTTMAAGRLYRIARVAVEGFPLSFAFDRPRRPVPLSEGVNRRHSALLLSVGLNLPRFSQQPSLQTNPTLFLEKLGSLVRMALSAAVQKRDFLRRKNPHWPAFLLDRARLVVVPIGLDAVTRNFLGKGLGTGGAPLDFARQVVQRLRRALEKDEAGYRMDACVDSAFGFSMQNVAGAGTSFPLDAAHVAGLTAWDPHASAKNQLRTAGPLHAEAEAGTVSLLFPEKQPIQTQELVDLVRYAWQNTAIVRLSLAKIGDPPAQWW